MLDLKAEAQRIVDTGGQHPFTSQEAEWLSGLSMLEVRYEWTEGRVGEPLLSRGKRTLRRFSRSDLLYLFMLKQLGCVRGPEWRAELRRSAPVSMRQDRKTYNFGPFPIPLRALTRKAYRRVQQLAAVRLYVVQRGGDVVLGDTGLSPHYIARRLEAEHPQAVLEDHPSLTAKHLRRARRYAELHPRPKVRDPRRTIKKLLTAGSVEPAVDQDRDTADHLGDVAPLHAVARYSMQAWREKLRDA